MSPSFTLEGYFFGPSAPEGPGRLTVRHGLVAAVDPLSATGPTAAANGGPLRLPDGYVVVPGFVDAHTHLVGLGLQRLRPDCGGATSRAEALSRVADWLRAHAGTGPVIGEGWDQSDWDDPAVPTRRDLDAICPDRPLALRRVCGHVAVFNSRALALLGDAPEGLDPESGLALEHLPLTIGRVWPPDAATMDQAVQLGQTEAWQRGVTGIHEMGHPGTFRAFGRAQVAGSLRLRVTHFFPIDRLDAVEAAGLVAGAGGEHLRVGGVKLFLDGSIGGRTAAVRVPYPVAPGAEPGGAGMLLWEDLPLREALERAARLGFPPAMHAIGDRAIAQAISVVERMRADGVVFPPPGPRLEHAEMLDAELLARGVSAGFLFSMQPNFTARWQHPGGLYEQVLTPPRAAALNPFRAVALAERLLFGSDTMPLNPLLGLAGAIGHPVAGQRLCFRSALRRYTREGAAAVPAPFGDGSLVPGARADFVALRLPPDVSLPIAPGVAASPPMERLEVAATWVGGACVYADPALREAVPAVMPSGDAV
jgi:predicted amidohydrolase YtcJ